MPTPGQHPSRQFGVHTSRYTSSAPAVPQPVGFYFVLLKVKKKKKLVLLSGHWGARAPVSGDSKQTRFGHSPRAKSKGRGTSVGETRKGLISERPTPGRPVDQCHLKDCLQSA